MGVGRCSVVGSPLPEPPHAPCSIWVGGSWAQWRPQPSKSARHPRVSARPPSSWEWAEPRGASLGPLLWARCSTVVQPQGPSTAHSLLSPERVCVGCLSLPAFTIRLCGGRGSLCHLVHTWGPSSPVMGFWFPAVAKGCASVRAVELGRTGRAICSPWEWGWGPSGGDRRID